MTDWIIRVLPNVKSDSNQVKIWVAEKLAKEISDRFQEEVQSATVEAAK